MTLEIFALVVMPLLGLSIGVVGCLVVFATEPKRPQPVLAARGRAKRR